MDLRAEIPVAKDCGMCHRSDCLQCYPSRDANRRTVGPTDAETEMELDRLAEIAERDFSLFALSARGAAEARKVQPICTGVLDYFPDALLAVASVSRVGNDQHNPGESLHWARDKSMDHADALLWHLTDRGRFDTDGQRHSAKVAWRALALLQEEIETERAEDGRDVL